MRLVCGCTLESGEIAAIRKGESLRETIDAHYLRNPFQTDKGSLRDALELLAWMVAKGILEIRLAVARHPDSGEILGENGLFHAKYGIIKDGNGDRIGFSGSINETLAGWTKNWDSFLLMTSWNNRAHVESMEATFQALWENREKTAVVMELGEALKEHLLNFAPQDNELPARLKKPDAPVPPAPPKVSEEYEKVTGMPVGDRQPYAGRLVFAAFSGSHQDAIAKGMNWRKDKKLEKWTVPYLPIDPHDVGRTYDADVIRINSQSGKGGIGYLMENTFGIVLPQNMRESFGYLVKSVSDHAHKELKPEDVLQVFNDSYVNLTSPIKLYEHHYEQRDGIKARVTVEYNGEIVELKGEGNGRLDAVNHALATIVGKEFTIEEYQEHALSSTSKSQAVAYVCISHDGGKKTWGVGIHNDIIAASVAALVSAVNNMLTAQAGR